MTKTYRFYEEHTILDIAVSRVRGVHLELIVLKHKQKTHNLDIFVWYYIIVSTEIEIFAGISCRHFIIFVDKIVIYCINEE